VKPKVKKSPLSLALSNEHHKIDWDNLTEADILNKSTTGLTLLHQAARDGFYKKIPQKLRDRKYWTETNEGTTVLISAYLGSDQSWLDKQSLTTQDLLKQNNGGDSIASLAIQKNIFQDFPKEIITKEVLTQKIKCDGGDTILHKLARRDQLNLVPKIFLTEEILSSKGNYGESIFHILSESDHYEDISPKKWTRSAMTLKADNGATPLHHICHHNPSLVSEDITLDDILSEADKGATPLYLWASTEQWHKIPDKFLTRESLEYEVDFIDSPLQLIMRGYELALKYSHKIPEETKKFKTVLSKISDRALNKLANKGYVVIPLVKQKLIRRKVLKELGSKEQSI